MDSEKIITALKKCDLFSGLSDKELAAIAEAGTIEEYNAGDTIYKQGDVGKRLYILSEGQVSLSRNFEIVSGRHADKVVYILRESPNRRLMGGWCTLVGEQHIQMCSANCDKPSKIISFESSNLKNIISENMNTRLKILEKLILILRERLESSYSAMETL